MSTPAPKLPEFVRRIVDELYACGVGCAPALCDNGPGASARPAISHPRRDRPGNREAS
jgi:hypothetical protein